MMGSVHRISDSWKTLSPTPVGDAAMDEILTCLFWNMNRRHRPDLIGRLAAENQADIVVLAEAGFDDGKPTLDALRGLVDSSFHEPPTDTPRLHVYSRHRTLDLQELFGDIRGRVTVRRLQFRGTEFLLAAVHFPSKLHWKPEDQAAESGMLAMDLRQMEEQHRHRRTIVVGDLNMNPFEAGVVNASGLHAMMTRALVNAGSRRVQGREFPFFYNPMWGFFGDRTPGPPGTYYYRHPGHLSYDWNMFDQVLLRPEALPWFQDDVAILTRVGDVDLLGRFGRPDPEVGSDHLPIVFRLVATE